MSDQALCPGCEKPSGFLASTIIPGNTAWHHECWLAVHVTAAE